MVLSGATGAGIDPTAPGAIVAGKFRLERPLGQGGMGAVWLARHTALQIPCAVKFLHAGVASNAMTRARFEREAVAAAQIRSPHVVQILDHGVWEGVPYIAMELLDGEDLAHRLHRVGSLGAAETVAILTQIARALARAHAMGLVHRDLKPANVFLVRDDDREIAKVLDFGVAKAESGADEAGMTQTGAVLGTPYYMSPEQAQGRRDVDGRTDVWALGVIAFQCLTGQLPFTGNALGDLFMNIIVRPFPVPSTVGPVPAGFDAWWLRAMARDPAERCQSARELVDSLEAAIVPSGEASLASSASLLPAHGPVSTPALFSAADPALMGPPTGMSAAVTQAPLEASPRSSPRVALAVGVGLAVAALALVVVVTKALSVGSPASPHAATIAEAGASAAPSSAPPIARPEPTIASPASSPSSASSAAGLLSVPAVEASAAASSVVSAPRGPKPGPPRTRSRAQDDPSQATSHRTID